MKALRQRSAEEGREFHNRIEPRVYAENEVQKERIKRSRKMLHQCVGDRKGLHIVELGCGTMDISGPFALKHQVQGMECNYDAAAIACERWPGAVINNISFQPESSDVLVLCEFLEHITNPAKLVQEWLPLTEQSIISHPLNGDLTNDLSGGEHQWSFDESDFANWFS